jgi:hypothetical protein
MLCGRFSPKNEPVGDRALFAFLLRFLLGVLGKEAGETWFLDGECVVKRGGKTSFLRALKFSLF